MKTQSSSRRSGPRQGHPDAPRTGQHPSASRFNPSSSSSYDEVLPEVSSSDIPSTLNLTELKKKDITELVKMAREYGIENASSMRGQEVIFALLKLKQNKMELSMDPEF